MNQSLLSPKGFLEALHPHADKPLVFAHGGECIRPGYHVTEVRAARVQSLDCGGHPESWAETLVQLWDPPGKPGEGFMPVSKFLSVYGRVAKVPLEGGSRLLFEWGDASTPAVRYTVADLTVEGGAVVVHLSPVYAACKPKLGVTPSPRRPRAAVAAPEQAGRRCPCPPLKPQASAVVEPLIPPLLKGETPCPPPPAPSASASSCSRCMGRARTPPWPWSVTSSL